VPPRDPRRLAQAIRTYALDPALRARHGLEARRLAESLFIASQNARAVLDLYYDMRRHAA
jgi:glycosyltransferase involved in cell wall biosynthesis